MKTIFNDEVKILLKWAKTIREQDKSQRGRDMADVIEELELVLSEYEKVAFDRNADEVHFLGALHVLQDKLRWM